MTRTFITTPEQDAALAFRAKQLGISESEIIAQFAASALSEAVAAYLDSEGSRVYELFKKASVQQQAEVIATLEARMEPIKRGA